jgi:hypothetical protein
MPQRSNGTVNRVRAGVQNTLTNREIDAISVLVLRRISQAAPAGLLESMETELLELAQRRTGAGLPPNPRNK